MYHVAKRLQEGFDYSKVVSDLDILAAIELIKTESKDFTLEDVKLKELDGLIEELISPYLKASIPNQQEDKRSGLFSKKDFKTLAVFLPYHQQEYIKEVMQARESLEDMSPVLFDVLTQMKSLKANGNIDPDTQIAKAHYFGPSGTHWYILNYDRNDELFFGYAVLNDDWQMAEYGYSSVEELKSHRFVELDFYWTPEPLKGLINQKAYPDDPDEFKSSLHFKEDENTIRIVSDLEGELYQIEKSTWQNNPNQDTFINLLYANMKGKTNSSDVDWQNAAQLLSITPQTSKEQQRELWDLVVADLTFRWSEGEKITAREIKVLAQKLDITDLGLMYELVELAWVIYYRELLFTEGSFEVKFKKVVDFYTNHQPTFSYTDSNKKLFQQYSTAAPIALLAGWYCDAHKASSVFEPSAGNGLLTILSDYDKTVVNEIDQTRLENLSYQPFRKVLSMDASKGFPDFYKSFEVVLSNPPFGNLPERNTDFDGYIIKKLDHVMIAHALDTMKDEGKAALIIGGHTHFNEKGMIQSHRTFFNWLYHNYHVADMINIDSRELYGKQGTAFPLRLILIEGRKKYPTGFATQATDEMQSVVASFDELYQRVERAKTQQFKQDQSPIALALQQLAIILNT